MAIRCRVCEETAARCVWEAGVWTYFPCGHERPVTLAEEVAANPDTHLGGAAPRG